MQKRALCIGINNYPGTGSDLYGCVNDANDWKTVLESRGYVVEQLLDSQATKAVIQETMRRIIRSLSSGDRFIIQYSGHGSWIPDLNGDEPDQHDEVLCPYDIFNNQPLTDDELFESFDARRRGVRIVFISDSCHSGTVARFALPLTISDQPAPVRFLPPETFLPKTVVRSLGDRQAWRAVSPPGRHEALLLAGCRDTEYSYDAWFHGRPNGAFSYVALQALTGLTGTATYRDWYRAIQQHLPTAIYPQTPQLFGTTTQKRWGVLV